MSVPPERLARLGRLGDVPRATLAALPTPLHPLPRLSERLGGPEIWIKRDDLSGLAGGGNKTRKLEFLVADALRQGADTLVTVGAIQSNHTRQTAAAAAKTGLRCVLLHNAWAPPPGPDYRRVGNLLLSGLLGAELYYDPVERHIDDAGHLEALIAHLGAQGHTPYFIPGGGSEHPLGGFGYAMCAAELAAQAAAAEIEFDYLVHCTGSSSTQAGLLAGFAALGIATKVIGVADDDERVDKCRRIRRLAEQTLRNLEVQASVEPSAVEVVLADPTPYGVATEPTFEAIRLLAHTEGIIADPVYEGRALRGLRNLVAEGRLGRGDRVLLMHLGGSPAVHAWADRIHQAELRPLPFDS